MTRMTPSEFAREVGCGLLSFPVSSFNPDLSFNEHGIDVRRNAFGRSFSQISRQQQESVGTGALGCARELLSDGGTVAGTGNDGHSAGGLGDGGGYNLLNLGRQQREELAGTSGCEQAADRMFVVTKCKRTGPGES
jgi:hypothetical protein